MIDASARAAALQPEWLPHSFSPDGTLTAFVHVPREEHDKLTFLSDQFFQNRYPTAVHRRSEIEALLPGAPQGPLHFIFHTGFCCSTLLVKALTVPGRVMGLKEPIVLNDLALRAASGGDPNFDALLKLTLRLLARPFDANGAVVAKATNVANRIAEPVLQAAPEPRAVLLYSELQSFLLALARHGPGGRQWARQLHASLSQWTPLDFARETSALAGQGDLEAAALAWLLQIDHFNRLARAFGKDRVMLLTEAELLGKPSETLARVSEFLGLGLEAPTIEGIVAGPVFHSHSKALGIRYSIEDRRRDQAATEQAHGQEVEAASAWLRDLAGRHDVPLGPSFAD